MLRDTQVRLSDLDLEHRRPVWLALSDLFLDTSFDTNDIDRIARPLSQSPYSLEQLDRILLSEVYPACGGNLLSLAGEWTGFDPIWLESRILQGPSLWRRLVARTVGRVALVASADAWTRVKRRVEATR